MNFQSLTKLQDKKYCENMIILTSDIIEKYLNNKEITYLAQRIKNGVEVNEMETDNVTFFNKEELGKYDVNTPLSKRRICSGIAKFYVKIAHLFAAIIMTINPIYTYKDSHGNTVVKNVMEKATIPVNAKDRKVIKKGICASRVEALTKGQDFENISPEENIQINPNVCGVNRLEKSPLFKNYPQQSYPQQSYPQQNYPQQNYPQQSYPQQSYPQFSHSSQEYRIPPFVGKTYESPFHEEVYKQQQQQLNDMSYSPFLQQQYGGEGAKSLNQEPGIPELFDLYLDKYDYQSGTFTEMTQETSAEYLEDLKKFYLSFTGELSMPPTIKKFSDIKLRDYEKTKVCQTGKPVQGSLKDFLFKKYAKNLQKMVQTSNQKQEALLEVINNIFTYDVVDNVKKIRIHPELTESGLKNLVEKTRRIIVDLYVTCEDDFVEGVKIYEAIIENQIRLTTESQIRELDTVSKQISIKDLK